MTNLFFVCSFESESAANLLSGWLRASLHVFIVDDLDINPVFIDSRGDLRSFDRILVLPLEGLFALISRVGDRILLFEEMGGLLDQLVALINTRVVHEEVLDAVRGCVYHIASHLFKGGR